MEGAKIYNNLQAFKKLKISASFNKLKDLTTHCNNRLMKNVFGKTAQFSPVFFLYYSHITVYF